jgi:hypothetical protein
MNGFERFFHGRYGAARAFLLLRVFMLMLALDTSMLMIGHAGRYGAGGFNVAHFRGLDAVIPLPTPGLYVGVLLAASLLALFIAISGVQRLTVATLALLYTYCWSMSMLDSYQHHYFMSLVLVCLCFWPRVSASELHGALPAPAPPAAAPKKQKHLKRQAARDDAERAGWQYALGVGGGLVAYLALRPAAGGWAAFGAVVALVAGASWLYDPSRGKPRAETEGFGFPLLCATVAVLYLYAAVAKMDQAWLDGFTVRRISQAETTFSSLVAWLVELGLPAERFWALFSSSVIPLELAVGAAYLLAAGRDRSASPWPGRLCGLGFALAMGLHVGAEVMELQIGWFSYYMIAFAVVCLLPLRAVDALAVLASWPARYATRFMEDWQREDASSGASSTLAMAVGAASVLGVVAWQIGLPGAPGACGAAALALVGVTLAKVKRGAHLEARPTLIAGMLAGGVLWLAIALSPVRWDYYRYLGGDLMRRGESEAALEVYLKGERFAPTGESRQDKIDELRRLLRQ